MEVVLRCGLVSHVSSDRMRGNYLKLSQERSRLDIRKKNSVKVGLGNGVSCPGGGVIISGSVHEASGYGTWGYG